MAFDLQPPRWHRAAEKHSGGSSPNGSRPRRRSGRDKRAPRRPSQSGLAPLFSLRYDFPTEWSAFVNGSSDYAVVLLEQYFPFMVQSINLAIDGLTLYASNGTKPINIKPLTPADLNSLAAACK